MQLVAFQEVSGPQNVGKSFHPHQAREELAVSNFEREVQRDVEFVTGIASWDPVTAILGVTSEESRRAICLNDDLTWQIPIENGWRQLFIANPQANDTSQRNIIPQLVIGRDISANLQEELGWFIVLLEDYPLGSMTLEEQQKYLAHVFDVAEPIDPALLDARIMELAPILVDY